MVTTNYTREQAAQPVIALVERFGFGWETADDAPLPELDRRLQVRDPKNYAPTQKVGEIRAAMDRGEILPPIVVTRDGHLIDGNTRVTAAMRSKRPTIHTIVLDVRYEDASDDERHRLWSLGAAFNARHGKGINRDELRRAVSEIGDDPTYSAVRIASLIGVTERVVQTLLHEKKARDRAEELGLHVNGSINAPRLGILGRQSDKLNDEPFKAIFSLVEDTGMSVGEIRDLSKRVIDAKADAGALVEITQEREARKAQIATYRASGKAVPPVAAKVRQRIGFILGYEDNPQDMLEHNPALAAAYRSSIERSIKVLEAVLDAQEG